MAGPGANWSAVRWPRVGNSALHHWKRRHCFGTSRISTATDSKSLLMLALQHGLVLHAGRPFYPADIVAELAAATRPRLLVTTPIHLQVLLAEPGEIPPVDLVLSATAPLSAELARAAEARFAVTLCEIYGCSEAGQIAVRTHCTHAGVALPRRHHVASGCRPVPGLPASRSRKKRCCPTSSSCTSPSDFRCTAASPTWSTLLANARRWRI